MISSQAFVAKASKKFGDGESMKPSFYRDRIVNVIEGPGPLYPADPQHL